MKIVDVCAFYSPHGGGIKTYVEQKLRIAPQLGHDITVIAPGDRRAHVDLSSHARIITLPSPRFPLDRKYWYFDDEPGLHAALDTLNPDFVEVSSPWRSPSMVARWRSSVPRAIVMHADPLSAYAYRWLDPILPRPTIDRTFRRYWDHLRQLSLQFDATICASDELRQRLSDGGVRGTCTVPMGVDGDVFSPVRRDAALRRALLRHCGLDEQAHLLIGVGRLTAEKRWPLVIDAVVAASNTRPLGLVLFGEGKDRQRIERHIGGNPHIRLMGVERDRARFAAALSSADALIHGCEAETFCMAAAEANACGLAMVVPDRGGAADHARRGSGLAYRSGDALSASHAILQLLDQAPVQTLAQPVTMHDHFSRLFALYATIAGQQRIAA